MRKLGSLLFLCVFLFNIVGYYPVFLLRQQNARNGISKIIDEKVTSGMLVVFTINEKEIASLKWIREDEFSYKDELFDVVFRETESDGRCRLYCINDKKEKALISGLKMHIAKHLENSGNNPDKKQNQVKPLLKDYCPPENTFHFVLFESVKKYIPSEKRYAGVITDKLSPPPEFS